MTFHIIVRALTSDLLSKFWQGVTVVVKLLAGAPLEVLDLSLNDLQDAGTKASGTGRTLQMGGQREKVRDRLEVRLYMSKRICMSSPPTTHGPWPRHCSPPFHTSLLLPPPPAQGLASSLLSKGLAGLKVLALSNNGIKSEGARALAAALPALPSLEVNG